MTNTKRLFATLTALVISGCAGSPYINTYRAGVITKEIVTESHKQVWSEPLRDRAAACDASVPEDAGIAAFEACLEPFTADNNAKVVKALAAYKTAAAVLSAILIAAEAAPDQVDKEALKAAFIDTLAAARELISLFPEAEAWVQRLELLLGGLV